MDDTPANDWSLIHGRVESILPKLPAHSVDAVVTDPPYGLEFSGQGTGGADVIEITDRGTNGLLHERGFKHGVRFGHGIEVSVEFQRWVTAWARELHRIVRPGGYVLAFGHTRLYHRLTVGLEDAGFEPRDTLAWVHGCLDTETEILVNGEWKTHDGVEEGDLALCYDLETDEYAWQPVQRVVRFWHADTAYRLVGAHTDQLVTADHRCVVERDGTWSFEVARDVAPQREARVPVLEDLPALLRNLPSADQGTGSPQQGVLAGVRGRDDRRFEEGRPESVPVSSPDVSGVPGAVPSVANETAPHVAACVLDQVSGGAGPRVPARNRSDRSCRVDAGIGSQLLHEDVGSEQPCVAWGSDVHPPARQLQGRQARPVPASPFIDGAQERLRAGASAGGSGGDWQAADRIGGGPSPGPRLAEQCGGEPGAVRVTERPQAVRGVRHTSSDLVRVEPVRYDGVAWCVTVPPGAFVARRRGKVFVTGNSGMPKGNLALDGEWDGWGTHLKPALEPVVLARKPMSHNVRDNMALWGTAAINIDGCRIDNPDGNDRWPANLILDEDAAGELDRTAALSGSTNTDPSRFYYCAKPSEAEKTAGLDGDRNEHPTRKPLALARWLTRLACRPGGVVLDPFMGSGTFGVAAVSEGMRFVGIDMDADYVHLSRRRITHAAGCGESDPQVLLGAATEPLSVLDNDGADSQMALFG